MTKLVSLRVVVATDDDAAIDAVKGRLQTLVAGFGSERLANGEDPEATELAPRVHWVTIAVLQGVDRATPTNQRRKRTKSTPGQSELPT